MDTILLLYFSPFALVVFWVDILHTFRTYAILQKREVNVHKTKKKAKNALQSIHIQVCVVIVISEYSTESTICIYTFMYNYMLYLHSMCTVHVFTCFNCHILQRRRTEEKKEKNRRNYTIHGRDRFCQYFNKCWRDAQFNTV